jgi:hypothetical protein
MLKNQFLRKAHVVFKPRTYLEIGVAVGGSLAQSRTRSIGVDPSFKITAELRCNVHLARATSDDFFARPDALAHFRGQPVDLALIDGMHLFEYALRDFINVEKHSTWTSVIVLDDMLPRNDDEAARDPHTRAWTGDVFKLMPVLHHYRPDLTLVPVATRPTGVLIVLGADPKNTVLADKYDEIVSAYASDDPQQVPTAIRQRTLSAGPKAVLDADFWGYLRKHRGKRRLLRPARVRRSVEKSFHNSQRVAPALEAMRRDS